MLYRLDRKDGVDSIYHFSSSIASPYLLLEGKPLSVKTEQKITGNQWLCDLENSLARLKTLPANPDAEAQMVSCNLGLDLTTRPETRLLTLKHSSRWYEHQQLYQSWRAYLTEKQRMALKAFLGGKFGFSLLSTSFGKSLTHHMASSSTYCQFWHLFTNGGDVG